MNCGRPGFWPATLASMDRRREEVKPHKVRYYLEQRDPGFAEKMAEVLCVYRQVKILKQAAAVSKQKKNRATRWRSSLTTRSRVSRRSQRPPRICRPSPASIRPSHGSMNISATAQSTCWPASTSSPARSIALVRDRHRSREFIEFLKLLDAAYPAHTAIKLILDNHSAHISKETKAWLADQPAGRFEFTFTPKHGSWLNLLEGFFSKLARSVLRHIRVTSKQELKDRIMAAMDHFNQDPVVHTWSYKLDQAA